MAQDEKPPVPVIGHYPLKLHKRGNELTIKAHVSGVQVERVSLVVWVGEKTAKGRMARQSKARKVPVSAVPTSPLGIRAKPSPNAGMRGVVNQSNVLKIGKRGEHYYGVMTEDGLRGYVPEERVKVLTRGSLYSITLPSKATNRASLTYQIEASDVYGRTVRTDKHTVRFLTQAQVRKLLAQRLREEPEKGQSIFSKVWFWGGLLLAGGGAYFLLSGEEESEPATVDVLINWQ